MCGRFNIVDDPLSKITSEILGIEFSTKSNSNACPSETIQTVCLGNDSAQLTQQPAQWGIKPSWAKKLLINAQSETVHNKKTFKHAFQQHRCIIPFSGWYEWKTQASGNKQKYLFEQSGLPLFMAGILFDLPVTQELPLFADHELAVKPACQQQLVTLTTSATKQCEPIHHRMPLLIEQECLDSWLKGTEADALSLLVPATREFDIKAC
jgi:putative SOS response-associated peptidase YedK